MAERGAMTVREAGRKGGSTTKRRHGPDFYKSIGKKGGETTKQRHGPQFYEKIGRKGGQTMKKLIEQGQRAAKKGR
jgi:general stress protein YciG